MTAIDGGLIDIDSGAILKAITLKVRLRHKRVMSVRCRLAALVVGVADRIAPCRLELVTAEPPSTRHDVLVEKIGTDMRLVVGDRAVRLERRDAEHLGDLLSTRWAGTIARARADDPRPAGDGGGGC